jgi:hypothetical protein
VIGGKKEGGNVKVPKITLPTSSLPQQGGDIKIAATEYTAGIGRSDSGTSSGSGSGISSGSGSSSSSGHGNVSGGSNIYSYDSVDTATTAGTTTYTMIEEEERAEEREEERKEEREEDRCLWDLLGRLGMAERVRHRGGLDAVIR